MLTVNPQKVSKCLNCVLIPAFYRTVGQTQANSKCYSPYILISFLLYVNQSAFPVFCFFKICKS